MLSGDIRDKTHIKWQITEEPSNAPVRLCTKQCGSIEEGQLTDLTFQL